MVVGLGLVGGRVSIVLTALMGFVMVLTIMIIIQLCKEVLSE